MMLDPSQCNRQFKLALMLVVTLANLSIPKNPATHFEQITPT